jgi:hypothetical protein
MSKVVKRAVMVVGPIVAVVLIAFAVYGTEGPPDNAPVDAVTELVGVTYGAYLAVLTFVWLRAARAK